MHIDNDSLRVLISSIVVITTGVSLKWSVAYFTEVRSLDNESSRFDGVVVVSDGLSLNLHIDAHMIRKCLFKIFEGRHRARHVLDLIKG